MIHDPENDPETDPEDTHSDDDPDQDETEGTGQPAVVDESQFAGDDDDDDDDDDMPAHFNVVAQGEDEKPADGDRPEPTPEGPPEIPLNQIDPDALWVVKRLHAKGYEAYLTGGCVRDLLLGRTPKDFDVATAAHPNQVKSVFRNCRLVGRRFRLAHVFFPSGKVIETATFRANPIDTLEDLPDDLLVERDNVFGNVEEDARRRDLTVNGLFYDPLKGKVLDFVDGRKDLEARLIRTIGDPEVRFREDPVRILRAIKFATRLGFSIEEKTFAAMKTHVGELVRCAAARLQEEMLRLLTSGHAREAWKLCDDVGVTRAIVPELLAGLEMPLEPKPVTSLPAPSATVTTTSEGEAQSASSSEGAAIAEGNEDVPSIAPVVGEGVFQRAEPPQQSAPLPPNPSERATRLEALLNSLDEAKKRDLDMSSSVAFAVLLTPVWEALRLSTTPWEPWFEETSQKWSERIRLTRHDKERIPQILAGQDDLLPHRRRGQQARQTAHRPSFKESLLLYTLRLHAQNAPLDEIGLWKVLAQNAGAAYRQPRLSERGPRLRAAAGGERSGGGGGGRGGGRGRGRDRGRRRRH